MNSLDILFKTVIFCCYVLPPPQEKTLLLFCLLRRQKQVERDSRLKMEDFLDVLLNNIKSNDFYALLGCDELASSDQINAEFRHKAKLLHPDKKPDDESAAKLFERSVVLRSLIFFYSKLRNLGDV